jgi:ComF family protein
VCAYDGAARTAVHTFKYRSGRYLAPLLGELLRNSMCRVPLRAEVIVPVPLSAHRRHDRGYNQAALLAEQVAPSVGGTVAEVLVRDDRPAQQTLSAAERQVNLRNAIRCANPEAIRGRRVLLIDDVATTGSSLSACADALAAAGAARISALVFARDL